MLSNDVGFRIISKMLDGCALRHKVIAANLANAETPGYRRLEVRFEDQLARAVGEGDPKQIDDVAAEVVSGRGEMRPDGNNVDFGTELSDMTKNTMLFTTFAELAAARVRRYREAIGD
ncbi:MAG TPA: flagellar basal body rod protein FlgB [Planctomycetota bacterium]|nr:flagellar basal body rod protein FlgB [Planctomycetota bacterium]